MNKSVLRYCVFGIDGDMLIERYTTSLSHAILLARLFSNFSYTARIWDTKNQCFVKPLEDTKK